MVGVRPVSDFAGAARVYWLCRAAGVTPSRPDRLHGCSGRSANRFQLLGADRISKPSRACDASAARGPEPLVTQQDRSAPIVVSDPCPVWTTVSSGSANSFERIDASIVGRSLNERRWRQDRPGRGVPGEHTTQFLGVQTHRPWRVARCAAPPGLCPHLDTLAVGRSASHRTSGWDISHNTRSSGCNMIGAPVRSRNAGATRGVVVVGVRADDRRQPPITDDLRDHVDIVRASMTTLVVIPR